jgi:hypothetical protein
VLVRQRFSTRNPGEITGYAVGLLGDTARGGGPVLFSGGKLAVGLTLPKVRDRWAPARTQPGDPFTVQERNAIWEHAGRAAYGRTPRPTTTGNSLRQTARLLAKAGAVGDGHTLTQVTLIAQLAALAKGRGRPASCPAARC